MTLHVRLVTALFLALFPAAPSGAQTVQPPLTSLASQQQDSVTLLADSVEFDQNSGQLIASGNVTILHQGRVLVTEKILYNQKTNTISIPRPLRIKFGEDSFVKAQSATLTDDLSNGLILGAQLLIQDQLQISAAEFHRKDDRFKVLYKTVASSCYICSQTKRPFWQIRARRIIHDELKKQIYFEGATLDFLGVPVFHAPYLRAPDPSVTRASGILAPTFVTSSTIGYGIKLPYYWTLGDHADVTLTPFITSKGNAVLEGQYRQRFKTGYLEVEGAFLVVDNLADDPYRSYIQGKGNFQLPDDFDLTLEVNAASDKDFMAQFDYGDQDRLESFVTLEKTKQNRYFSISAARTQSLRTNEVDAEIPLVLPEIYYRRTWQEDVFGGTIGLTGQAVSLLRENDNDYSRIGFTLDWRRDWTLNNGMIFGGYSSLIHNHYNTRNDPVFGSGTLSSTLPTAAVELRWPFSKVSNGVTHVIEPVAQIIWSPDTVDLHPNEDSTQIEFSENNLFSFNRFPGFDANEQGLRANIGITYWRYDPNGWNLGVTVGRVVREKDLKQFRLASGLAGTQSDYVSSLSLSFKDQFSFINRLVFNDDFKISKSETQILGKFGKLDLGASYTYLAANVTAPNTPKNSEGALLAAYQFNDYWSGMLDWRQNFITNRATEGEVGVTYENECVKISLSLSLRNASSGNVQREKKLGLSIELAGLGSRKQNRKFSHRCDTI